MEQQQKSSSTSMKPKCGVIGTGEEGCALISKLTGHGFRVCMANAGDSETLAELSEKTGAKAASLEDIVKESDLIFLCIPTKAIRDLPQNLFARCPPSTVVVDCCNYYPSRDGSIPEIEQGLPESVWVRNQIGRDVVKAFNSILAGALRECGRPHGADNRVALPISGDDEKAKQRVASVMTEMGFDAFDAGQLSESWKQQPGSRIYCTNLTKHELQSALPQINKDEMPKLRDMAYHKMKQAGNAWDWQSLSKMLQETYGVSQAKQPQEGGPATGMREPIST